MTVWVWIILLCFTCPASPIRVYMEKGSLLRPSNNTSVFPTISIRSVARLLMSVWDWDGLPYYTCLASPVCVLGGKNLFQAPK